jgi:hypothetical protein
VSYAIGQVIVGTFMSDELYRQLDDWSEESEWRLEIFPEDKDIDDVLRELGFEVPYVNSGDPTAWIGVEIQELDECQPYKLSEVKTVATAEQTAEAKKKYDALPEKLRIYLAPFDIYIVWSSS